ncbi:MAG: HEAT repeat domain-containing protein, partial [Planctomycetes bacterium]|nr:HEAT repeat domain-containing protein [Planctomycetota bacterium]
MNRKNRQFVLVTTVFIASLLAGGYSAIAADDIRSEAELIAVLKSDAGWLEKQAACRELRRVGTSKSVGALASLLNDDELSHMARYALETMNYPQVDVALRKALAKTTGMPKIGVIISIGVRRDTLAVGKLTDLLNGPNPEIARAAAGALGRIATRKAAQALADARTVTSGQVRVAVNEGLLAASEQLVHGGDRDMTVGFYKELLASDEPLYVRMGAFRGLIFAEPHKADGYLVDALAGANPLMRDMAAQIIAETTGIQATKYYAKALGDLPVGGQVALLRGLAGRGDRTARGAVAEALDISDSRVKLAAIKTLGSIGSPDDVSKLAWLLASNDADIADASRVSLTIMQSDGVNAAIASAAADKVTGIAKARLIEILAERDADQALPIVVDSLKDKDRAVRIAALVALVKLGGEDQTSAVIEAVKAADDSAERAAAGKTLGAICSRCGEDVLATILNALYGTDTPARIVLLGSLGRIGGPKAIRLILVAMNDPDEQVSGAAVRILSDWPTPEAAEHLFKLAHSQKLTQQVLGLRGYIRLARIEPSNMKKTEMLTNAMDLAMRP